MNPSPQESKIVLAMIGTIMFFLWNFFLWNVLCLIEKEPRKEPKWLTITGIDVLVAMVFVGFYCTL